MWEVLGGAALGIIIPALIFLIRMGPRLDGIELNLKAHDGRFSEHLQWAQEQAEAHSDFEAAMAKMAQAHADSLEWVKRIDTRLDKVIDNQGAVQFGGEVWDTITERRKKR